MTKANDLASLLDANGDVVSSALDNVPANPTLTSLGIPNHDDITVDGSGNLDVTGTVTADGLTVDDGGNNTNIRLQNTNSGSGSTDGFLIQHATNAHSYIWNYENADTVFGTNATERMRIDSSGNVGIGTGSPAATSSTYKNLQVALAATVSGRTDDSPLYLSSNLSHNNGWKYIANTTATQIALGTNIQFFNAPSGTAGTAATLTERLRIDSSGNLLVGRTTNAGYSANSVALSAVSGNGSIFDGTGNTVAFFNRRTSDGEILNFSKDGTTVGSIGGHTSNVVGLSLRGGSSYGGIGLPNDRNTIWPINSSSAPTDNYMDIGGSAVRFKDLYLSGGVYLGGTGASNYLDDYEEGSWTPFISGASTTGTGTYSTQIGRYVKVGKKVNCWGQIVSSSTHTGTGSLQISGFPFTKENSALPWGTETSISYFFGLSSYGTATDTLRLLGPVSNGTYARFHSFNNRGDTSAPPTPANFVSTASFYFAVTYEVQ